MADITTIGVGIDGREAKRGAQVVKGAFADIKKAGKSAQAGIKAVDSAIFSLKGAFAGLSAVAVTRALVENQKQLQATKRGLEFVTGSSQAASKEFEFLKETANDLGLNLGGIEKAYVGLAASAKGTAIEGKATRDIFLGISKASATLGLSADNMAGSLLAVQQIISKGTVSSEELKQQLGERLPGAFQIAARAMGVSTEALNKMLASGEVLAEDLIPKLARQLEDEFGGSAVKAAEGLTGQLNKLDNAFLEFGRTVSSSGILDPLIDAALELTRILGDPAFLSAAETAAKALGAAVSFAANNFDLLVKAGVSLLALNMGAKVLAAAKGFYELAKAATTAAAGTKGLVASLVAARTATLAAAAASRVAAAAFRALKLAIPFAAVFLAVDALAAWVFGANDAGEASDSLKDRVDALARSYENLSGARLNAAIDDVSDRIKELTEAETAANVAVEQLARREQRSDETLEDRNKALTRARADAEQATEDLIKAETLLAKLQRQAAGNSEKLTQASKDAAAAKRAEAAAAQTLAASQVKSREDVQALIADLNEQIATHGKGATAALQYQIANGELGQTLRNLGAEGQAAGEILLQLTARLESIQGSSTRSSKGLSDAAREMKSAKEAAASLIGDLEEQVFLFGKSAAEVDLYRVSVGDLADTFGRLPNGEELAGRFLTLSAELRKAEEEQQSLNDAQEAWSQLLADTEEPIDTLARQLGELYKVEALLTEQADALGLSQEDIALAFGKAAEKIQKGYDDAEEAANKNAEEMSQYAIQAARSIQGAFSNLFFDVMQGNFDGLADRFKATIDRMVADLIASQLMDFVGQQLGIGGGGAAGGGVLGGGGGGGLDLASVFGSIGSFFAPGSAVGNTFTVPGSGGHDSTMMLAPVTPGETVRISTPSQEDIAKREGRGDVGAAAPISVNMTINTPDANSFMASRGQVENSLLEMVQRGRRNS